MPEATNVPVRVLYRDTETGREVERRETLFWDDGILSTYYYSEGNQSCDCNRGRVFGDEEGSCSGQRYIIPSIRTLDGTLIYSEDEGLRPTETTDAP